MWLDPNSLRRKLRRKRILMKSSIKEHSIRRVGSRPQVRFALNSIEFRTYIKGQNIASAQWKPVNGLQDEFIKSQLTERGWASRRRRASGDVPFGKFRIVIGVQRLLVPTDRWQVRVGPSSQELWWDCGHAARMRRGEPGDETGEVSDPHGAQSAQLTMQPRVPDRFAYTLANGERC